MGAGDERFPKMLPGGLIASTPRQIVHGALQVKGIFMHDGSRLFANGELARQTGLATSVLGYYERVGLPRPAVRAGGRRHYRASSAERVAWIQLCQDVGYTLREILVVPDLARATAPRLRLLKSLSKACSMP